MREAKRECPNYKSTDVEIASHHEFPDDPDVAVATRFLCRNCRVCWTTVISSTADESEIKGITWPGGPAPDGTPS